MLPTHRLFDEAWLAPLLADPPHQQSLDHARPVIEAAIHRAAETLDRWRTATAALAAAGDATPIPTLLRVECDALPEAAQAAEDAVHDLMGRIAFKRRELMPLFPPLLDRIGAAHREAATHCATARCHLMAVRALADPGGPSSPVHGRGTRYVKSDRFDLRAGQSLSLHDRIRADRVLKRLGQNPVPVELDLTPLETFAGLWTMKAGGRNRFILRAEHDRKGPLFIVEDVGPWPVA